MKFLLFLFFIFAITGPLLLAGDSKVLTSVDKNRINIGEPVHLNVSLRTVKGTVVDFPDDPDAFVPFEILNINYEPQTISDGDSILHRNEYEIAVYDTGLVFIPPAMIVTNQYRVSNLISDTVFTAMIPLYCQLTRPDTLKNIHPEAALLGWQLPWWIITAIVLILLVSGYLFWRWYTRRKARQLGLGDYEIPQEPADIIALRRINQLQKSGLLKEKSYKEWYTGLSEILREYIENRFDNIEALEMTTTELLPYFSELMADDESIEAKKFLSVADLVKFAKHKPDKEPHEQYIEFVLAWVRKNGPRPKIETAEADNDE